MSTIYKYTFLLVTFCVIAWGMCFQMIPPGYVGVLVSQFGDKKGVEQDELPVGAHWIAPWKSIYRFPVFEQNHVWENDNCFHFQTSEGMAVNADVGVTFHLEPRSVPLIFQKYRRGMEEITHTFLRNYIRDAINKSASKIKIEDLYGSGKEQFFDDVQAHVRADLKEIGIVVSRIYLIGRFNFPPNVIAALNSKIEANQRAQQRENELREAEAQAKKEVAKSKGEAECRMLEAHAAAESNKMLTQSLTPELIMWHAVQKWDGKLPKFMGNGKPLVNMDR